MTTEYGVVQYGPAEDPLMIRLRSRESDGALGVVEMTFDAGSSGPPLHVHPTHGEGFYVIDGEMTFQLGEEIVTGGPGTWAFAPKDTAHTLANFGTREARLLCVFAPGGFERRFERILAEQLGEALPPPPPEGMTIMLGPPMSPGPRADPRA